MLKISIWSPSVTNISFQVPQGQMVPRLSNATAKQTPWLSRKILKERNNSEVPPLSFTQETNQEIQNIMSVFSQKPPVPNKLFGLDTSEYYSQNETSQSQFSTHSSQNFASQQGWQCTVWKNDKYSATYILREIIL